MDFTNVFCKAKLLYILNTFLTEKAFFPCAGPMMFIKKNQNIVFLLEIRK